MYRVAFVVAVLILAPLRRYTEAFGSVYFLWPALWKCVVHHSCHVGPCGLCIWQVFVGIHEFQPSNISLPLTQPFAKHQGVPSTGCLLHHGRGTHCQQYCLSCLKGKYYDTAPICPSSLTLIITTLICTSDNDSISLFQCQSHILSWTHIPFLDLLISLSPCTFFSVISGHWESCCSACSGACGFPNLCTSEVS